MRKFMTFKKLVAFVAALTLTLALMGCGAKSDLDTIQGKVWQLTDKSQELPTVFPISTAQYCLYWDNFEIEFLSDGSVLINASDGDNDYNSQAYYKYALVDGRLKLQAPLGSTCMLTYELTRNTLKLYDGDDYVIFTVSG